MSSTVTQSLTGRFRCQLQRDPWLAASFVKERILNSSNTFFTVALIILCRFVVCFRPRLKIVLDVRAHFLVDEQRFSGCGLLSLGEQPLCLGSCSPPSLRKWHHISDSSTSPDLRGTLMNQWLCRSADLLHLSSSVPVFSSRYECWWTFRTSRSQGFKLKIYWSWTLDPMIDMVSIEQ